MIYENFSETDRKSICFSPGPTPDDPRSNYPGFLREDTILPKGFRKDPGRRAFPCDVLFQRDVPVALRDGTIVYIDIFRPAKAEKVPVILNSTMFGKAVSYMNLDLIPNRARVPLDGTSGFETFEGADPAFWCGAGYAVVNMDIRGIGRSEGDACYFGFQDAQDNYDMIEYLGTCPWSSGKVSMAGNSWLAITQWYVAALNPPHLTCIAPWEGHGNMYDDEYMRGGIPNYSAARVHMSYSYNLMEDLSENMRKFPLMNFYWDDKYADFEKITCPAYVTASYTSTLHTHGTFEGFRRISSPEKWLRVHNSWEWPDFYSHEEDLRKFFDYYMKGIENNWPETPRVRICVLDPGHPELLPVLDRPETNFPLPEQQLVKWYLHAEDNTLQKENGPLHRKVSYAGNPKNTCRFKDHYSGILTDEHPDPDEKSFASFDMKFDEDTEITGYMKAKLWVEAKSAKDMDIYVRICKVGPDGEILFHDSILYQYSGPNGMLRASLRETDNEKSTPCEPVHPFRTISYLSPGEIVPVEIGLWPTSLRFHAGETLRLVVAGYDYLGRVGHSSRIMNFNSGNHIVHTGGKYDSYLLVPVIPSENKENN